MLGFLVHDPVREHAAVDGAAQVGPLSAVARSGSVAVSRGEITLSSYARHHRLTG
mgnify:CR=1 FL=1